MLLYLLVMSALEFENNKNCSIINMSDPLKLIYNKLPKHIPLYFLQHPLTVLSRLVFYLFTILTSYIMSICCLVTDVPSSNIKVVLVVSRVTWLNQISKKPTLIRINWSSCPRSQNPGTRLANSTTLCTLGVMFVANCCHNHTRCCSRDSAVELATYK